MAVGVCARLIGVAAAGAVAASLATGPAGLFAADASPCQIEGVERIVAVGDVHGAYDRFVEILRMAGLLDERLHWTGGRTHLVQTGDVLDRGPDSLKVLDLLDRLEDEARKAGGAVHALLGNHEVMRLLGDVRYVTPGEYQAFITPRSQQMRSAYLESTGKTASDTPLGFVEMRIAFGRDGKYGNWLRKHDTVAKINGILFLHGGISPAVADSSCDVINSTVHREISSDLDKTRATTSGLSVREDGPLWYRGLAQESDAFEPKVDEILSKQNARAMVIAHTVVPDGRVHARFGGKVITIDTGMQRDYRPDGRAAALEIRDGTFTVIYQDRRDVILQQTPATQEAAVVRTPR